jgi:hypothetical protein
MTNRARRSRPYGHRRPRGRGTVQPEPWAPADAVLEGWQEVETEGGVTVVNHFRYGAGDPPDLSTELQLAIAMDQRAFGPGQLVVATTDRDGLLLRLSHTDQTEPPEAALAYCLDAPGAGARAVVAYSHEEVTDGLAPTELVERFAAARAVAALHDLHLVDWWQCDEERMRSLKFGWSMDAEWWDVPGSAVGG